jgi:hypothetical protein
VEQFKDKKREKIISLLVLEKLFQHHQFLTTAINNFLLSIKPFIKVKELMLFLMPK